MKTSAAPARAVMTSREIRKSFFDFFASRGHTLVPSAPVIPGDDPTLLFTNAGMNQFKDVFLGTGSRPYVRAVDTQKCIRVSGKHNDLEEVGRDTYHHTFFEMLGNWSFGDYYKREAIAWAWELLTEVWKLPKERLWATVYTDDDEAADLWKNVTDIDPSHILRFGAKDNFWEMGETGPCGPCSEIHYDQTPGGTATPAMVNAGTPEVIEIWNLVFIQFDRDASGTLTPLPAKHVDTGMGFERITAVLQGKGSNYDTDVFTPLIGRVAALAGRPYDGRMDGSLPKDQAEADTAMRVIADHIRTLTFAIADGAVPSNEGRGYVLRRILRRAARFGRSIGLRQPFLHTLVDDLVRTMSDVFPEIAARKAHVESIVRGEEESFGLTLDRGLEEFDAIAARETTRASRTIGGADAFKLYDTFGFPFDLTAMMAQERGLTVDEKGFQQALDAQKARSRDAQRDSSAAAAFTFATRDSSREDTRFVGYTELSADATVTAAADGYVVLDTTPFYAESGGQVGDAGTLSGGGRSLRVLDTQKDHGVFGHRVEGDVGPLVGQKVRAAVDGGRRTAIARNHTATHLVHEALRRVLGEHLHQQGSLVAETHLRFDFNHFEKVTPEQLRAIEEMVNAKIAEAVSVQALNDPRDWVSVDEAKQRWPNVKMFFGEKYGDKVRVVEVDPSFSVELCGGTHVALTSDIGYFRFRSEGSVASGIRRIEAVTGDGALELARLKGQDVIERLAHAEAMLEQLLTLGSGDAERTAGARSAAERIAGYVQKIESLREAALAGSDAERLRRAFTTVDEVSAAVDGLIVDLTGLRKRSERDLGKERLRELSGRLADIAEKAERIGGVRVATAEVQAGTLDELKAAGDALRAKLGSGVGLLAAVIDDKVQLVCVVTDDLVGAGKLKAGAIVGQVAKIVGGGGGGRPHLATAGGKDVSKVTEALRKTPDIVRSLQG